MNTEHERANEILNSFVEMWNDKNPEHKLNEDLLPLIKDYIRYSYVAGWEDLRKQIKDVLKCGNDGDKSRISKYFLMAKLEFLEKNS